MCQRRARDVCDYDRQAMLSYCGEMAGYTPARLTILPLPALIAERFGTAAKKCWQINTSGLASRMTYLVCCVRGSYSEPFELRPDPPQVPATVVL